MISNETRIANSLEKIARVLEKIEKREHEKDLIQSAYPSILEYFKSLSIRSIEELNETGKQNVQNAT